MRVDDEPEVWNPEGLAYHFADVHRKDADRRFAFVLGAGASVQSGIPAAGALVRRWLGELHRRLARPGAPLERWATEEALGIPGFTFDQATSFYSQVFARRFRQHADEGYADLEHIMQGKDPSFGYSVLAQILAETRHRLVVTTNFDNLVADALSIFTATSPLVCGHESLAGFIRVAPRRPVVVKIHRDLLMSPMNRADEIAHLPAPWHEPLGHVFRSYTPIVLGYGGNDGSLMGFLDALPPRSIPGGLFWCYYGPGGGPSEQVRRLVARHSGAIVPIDGFDEFMALLSGELQIGLLHGVIESRARERVERYKRRAAELFRPSASAAEAGAGEVEASAEELEVADAVPAARSVHSSVAAERTSAAPPPPASPVLRAPVRGDRNGAPATASRGVTRGGEPAARERAPSGPHLDARTTVIRGEGGEPRSFPGTRVRIGRAADNDLVLDDAAVAAHHAELRAEPEGLLLVDLESGSGTWVGEMRVPSTGVLLSDERRGFRVGPVPLRVERAPVALASAAPLPASERASSPYQRALQQLVSSVSPGDDPWSALVSARAEPAHERGVAMLRAALARFPDDASLRAGLAGRLAERPSGQNVGEAVRLLRGLLEQPEEPGFPAPRILHDLAVLLMLASGVPSAGRALDEAWRRLGPGAALDGDAAALALATGIWRRLSSRDDSAALAVLKAADTPVAGRGPLGDPSALLRRVLRRLDPPSHRLYEGLVDLVHGGRGRDALERSEPRFAAASPAEHLELAALLSGES